jgi:hypothetical protein
MSAFKHFRSKSADVIEDHPDRLVPVGNGMIDIPSNRVFFDLYRSRKLAMLTTWIASGLCGQIQESLWNEHKAELCKGVPAKSQQPWIRREFRDVLLEAATGHKTPIDSSFELKTLLSLGARIQPKLVLEAWQSTQSSLGRLQRQAAYHLLLEREYRESPDSFVGYTLTPAQAFMLHLAGCREMDLGLLPESLMAQMLEGDLGL